MTDNKLTIAEAALHFDVSERTIRRWIESGKLIAERTNGQRFVILDKVTDACPNDHDLDKSVSMRLESENESLHNQLQRADSEIQHLRKELSRRDDELNHAHQLVALSQKNIASLTDQLDTSRVLIEDMRNRKPFWKRWFYRKEK